MCGLGSIRSQFRTCQVDERTKEKKGCFLGDIDTGGPWALYSLPRWMAYCNVKSASRGEVTRRENAHHYHRRCPSSLIRSQCLQVSQTYGLRRGAEESHSD